MRTIGFGDLAAHYRTMMQNAQMKADFARLGEELATGRVSDLKSATGSDLGNYSALETTLKRLAAFEISTTEAALFTESVQFNLGHIQDLASETAPNLLGAGNSYNALNIQAQGNDARAKLETIVSLLNARVGDRTLLAGTGTDAPALVDAETMMASLNAAVAGATTAGDVEAAVDAWFDTPGGTFETSIYTGTTDDLQPFRVGQNEIATLGLRADDAAIRDLLKGFAMATVIADGALGVDNSERALAMQRAGEKMVTANGAFADLRARVGTIEAQIEKAAVRNSSEMTSLEIARANIVQVDPFETATELQSTEVQLETLYTITARLSRLNLVDFLR
ncbi:Flagellar hook-associated protein FlgL [Candidatus Rhodobacter oscarellae]|uniref:Flagellar hook-associated protein FlgL n=1 Tax=Candidatus Rhodobacter oscarellae TaxID=1675527 RepID=A0A0J9H2X2_9RHOB|nr:flagellin [Candidatus Rhodobacter lobularis]KMW60033.1 Flagellar hook-associated protein FlgL [Candidatus Rhodobacter lobularis]